MVTASASEFGKDYERRQAEIDEYKRKAFEEISGLLRQYDAAD